MEVIVIVLSLLLVTSVTFNLVQSKKFPIQPQYYPGTKKRSAGFFPYLCSNNKYTSWIMLYNRSDYLIDVEFELCDDTQGAVSKKFTKTLKPHQCIRYSEATFEGSVNFVGYGAYDALYAIMEMRENSGKGVALASLGSNTFGMHWYFTIGVNDEGPGKNRSTLISRNLLAKPLYIEFGFGLSKCALGGKDAWATAHFHEMKVPARGHVKFSPYDKAKETVTDAVAAAGNTGEKGSGDQTRFHCGTHLVETPKDIALHNYKPLIMPYTSVWPKTPELYWLYFAGVQDDGIFRSDEIYIKNNDNYVQHSSNYTVHFYDYRGHEVSAPPSHKLCIALHFSDPKSSVTLSPRKFLGKEFNGSIVIELPLDHTGKTEAIIRRQAPGAWQDLSDSSPSRPYTNHVIPYVSNKDKNWAYQLILFYPSVTMKKSAPAPNDPPMKFNGPNVKIPPLGGGWVALKFHDMSGKYLGWTALEFKPNETKHYTVKQLIGPLCKEPFEGSIEIDPKHVISQLHTWSSTGAQHGFTGTWSSL